MTMMMMLNSLDKVGNMLVEGRLYPNHTIRVRTPAGTLFVSIVEDRGIPIALQINGTKNGSELAAFCDSTARLASEILESNQKNGISKLIELLSNITTDKAAMHNGLVSHSAIEGICLALSQYQSMKYKDNMLQYSDYRPPVFG